MILNLNTMKPRGWTNSTAKIYLCGVDGGKNPSQQRETLSIPKVPIRLTIIWYGRLDRIMDPLPYKFGGLVYFKAQEQ